MDNLKVVFGTSMIAMAFYFIHPVTPGPLFSGLIATTLFIFSYAVTPIHKSTKSISRTQKATSIILFSIGILFGIRALVPQHKLPDFFPGTASKNELQYAKPDWVNYSEEILKSAGLAGKPVILDFQAEWCLACKELEVYTFSDAKVLAHGKNFIWMKFDATKSSPELEALQEKYRIGGLPFIAFFDEKGQWRSDLTLTGFEKAPQFFERMIKIMAEK